MYFFGWGNFIEKLNYICPPFAGVVKLVDTLDLGSSASRRGGSSPFTRTFLNFSFLLFFTTVETENVRRILKINLLAKIYFLKE